MTILFGLFVSVLLVVVVTLLFTGIGYLLSSLLPLTLFEASLLLIVASLLLVVGIALLAEQHRFSMMRNLFDRSPEEDEEDWERPAIRPVRIYRNQLCPCGSGKKYKSCCGRR